MPKPSAVRRDVAAEITNLILEKLEQGVPPWKRPWRSAPGQGQRPLRHCGTNYTGINALYLWALADSRGYSSRYWMTYRQAEQLGAHVRKGERSAVSVYFSQFKKTAVSTVTGLSVEKSIRFLRHYLVFNADQVDGLPAYFYAEPEVEAQAKPSERQETIDRFFARIPATVRHGGSEAYFSPMHDYIQMPKAASFDSMDLYASTRLHEVGNIASVLVAGGAGEGAVERYLRHLHCGEQSPGGGRLDARTAAGAATQRCGVIGIAAGASGIRRRLPASRSSAVLAR
ncbi:ArdC family protein [Sphingomonas yabuuchiae]|uniref:ArdC family protein n=2 Tax=Sphingomonas yabuuchiae TaxID=172044 RepID=UPI00362233B2